MRPRAHGHLELGPWTLAQGFGTGTHTLFGLPTLKSEQQKSTNPIMLVFCDTLNASPAQKVLLTLLYVIPALKGSLWSVLSNPYLGFDSQISLC